MAIVVIVGDDGVKVNHGLTECCLPPDLRPVRPSQHEVVDVRLVIFVQQVHLGLHFCLLAVDDAEVRHLGGISVAPASAGI